MHTVPAHGTGSERKQVAVRDAEPSDREGDPVSGDPRPNDPEPNEALQQFDSSSLPFVENLFAQYAENPEQVAPAWREYFRAMTASANGHGQPRAPSLGRFSLFNPPAKAAPETSTEHGTRVTPRTQAAIDRLVEVYRLRGHRFAELNPLRRAAPELPGVGGDSHDEQLDPNRYGIDVNEQDRLCWFQSGTQSGWQTVRSVLKQMRQAYCGRLAVQYSHLEDPEPRAWLIEQVETGEALPPLGGEQERQLLVRLTQAAEFEDFVRKKYIGSKTFSLEGAEMLIPLLGWGIEQAAEQGVKGIVLGMAHRGRLNVLANIIGKSPQEIFWEFQDARPELHRGRGDVQYHLGYSGVWQGNRERSVQLSLCFNPSHLEFVNPVALGRTRAQQDRLGDTERREVMTLLIHGDAAFAGEGIVQESLNLSQLTSYHTGGTLHVIVNNQIGFTTTPDEGRSAAYSSDVARLLQSPVFHVHGEAPEAVAAAVRLAMDFRVRFRRDVVINLYGYRRWGHNEADEPSFTQPVMYQAIQEQPPLREQQLQRMLKEQLVTEEEAQEIANRYVERLRDRFENVQDETYHPYLQPQADGWEGLKGGHEPHDDDPATGVDTSVLSRLLVKLADVPDDFKIHRRLEKSTELRRKMASGQEPLDWSAAEALALATLALEKRPIRLSGQDSARGTFSQRHAVLHDQVDGRRYCPLQHLRANQGRVEIINSPLCEAAALAFEYGYSLDHSEALVIWEAQFGDFVNAAQVVIDQFLASAEDKWNRLSGLVLLLPHGFEGQGPEHSSARLERFLSLASEENIQVVYPSTPAQYFHLLRRQAKRRWRKPLIVLTPKSLLRHRAARSSLAELARGGFRRVLPDRGPLRQDSVRRILLCSGKIYYDLAEARDKAKRKDVAIVRVEQFYPLGDEILHAAIGHYRAETPVYWVQEEPENMGAGPYWRLRFGDRFLGRNPFHTVSRPVSASPATGSKSAHKREQKALIRRAFE